MYKLWILNGGNKISYKNFFLVLGTLEYGMDIRRYCRVNNFLKCDHDIVVM